MDRGFRIRVDENVVFWLCKGVKEGRQEGVWQLLVVFGQNKQQGGEDGSRFLSACLFLQVEEEIGRGLIGQCIDIRFLYRYVFFKERDELLESKWKKIIFFYCICVILNIKISYV